MRWMGLAMMVGLTGCIVDTTGSYGYHGSATVQSGGTVVQPASGPGVCQCVQGAREICNGCDDNCNGAVDEDCTGGGGGAVVAQPPGGGGTVMVQQPAPAVCHCVQGAREVCNGCDDNCNGAIDEDCVRKQKP